MSYTSDIKSAYASLDIKSKSAKQAEFYAIYMLTGGKLRTSNRDVAFRYYTLCGRTGAFLDRVSYKRGASSSYLVSARWSGTFNMKTSDDACGFLRGCFMAGGYANDPNKPTHIELSFSDEICYELGMAAFELAGIFVKGTIRNGKYVLYIKDSDEFAAFLAKTGAVRALLDYENVRIIKDTNRMSQRLMNFDDANINKSIETGLKQKHMAEEIKKSPSYADLPEELKDTVEARINYPELSLQDLGQLFSPCISKAGVAHRMKKLEKIYLSLSDK